MVRIVLAVIAGYAIMAALVMGTLSGAYLALGAERAFRPGSYDVSGLWIAVSFGLGLIAAFWGGYACARIGRDGRAPRILVGLVLVLGIASAIPPLRSRQPLPPRTGDVDNFTAMQRARTPAWIALANPLVGAAGVWLGARRAVRGVAAVQPA